MHSLPFYQNLRPDSRVFAIPAKHFRCTDHDSQRRGASQIGSNPSLSLSLSRRPSQWLIRHGPLSSSSTASSSPPLYLSLFLSDIKALTVGDEIKNDPLPLHMGQRIYELRGLRESAWYEVKISYPVSIPARFSIQLKTGESELWLRKNRRLLNTEKLIFKADGHRPVYVIVTVEAEGFVAKPNLKERELAVFNIGHRGKGVVIIETYHDEFWKKAAWSLHLFPKDFSLFTKYIMY
ncbi:uncharacterized protein LOC103697113 isoform X2 [Phoenix dactylifera]|uniref:Uncharacterized protein LOC103697113 isoform X2 n=1 Tax=Phoenix dactylifera TaxID=42345 RepID=A0A8B8ZFV9_PHODC|nr:uncharacterized protein LOC103697113 isoform X2 [Phoenix dactylifera]